MAGCCISAGPGLQDTILQLFVYCRERMFMLNFNPELVSPDAILRNQRAIERHVTDDHYVRRFTPGMFVIGGAAVPTYAFITAAAPRWPAILMPDAATSLAAVSWEKPSEWRSGKLRICYWYTSPVGSTANFTIQLSVDAARVSEVLPATSLLSASATTPGPAIANTLIRSADTYTTTSFGPDDELFSLRITRIGADANDVNVNEFDLVYAKVLHIPAQRESQ